MNYLIDSDILIDILRGIKKSKEFVQSIIDREDNIYYSEISEIELLSYYRCEDPIEKNKIKNLFQIFLKVIIDNEVSELAADIKRKYGLSLPDAIIAASCIITDSILITRNKKDFERVKGLQVISP